MSKFKRVWRVISGIFIILVSLLLVLAPEYAFVIIALVLSLMLVSKGLHHIIYYLTMANNMVGGKTILFYGIFMLDLGIFILTSLENYGLVVIIYLIAVHLIGGVIDVVRAVRNKKDGYSIWKFDLAQGVVNLLLAIMCMVFINNVDILVYVYCGGLIYSALVRIASAFKKTAIVYIQ